MSLLDRHIARQFLTNVVVLFVILFCFIITIDVSLNIDRFSRIAAELMATHEQSGFVRRATLTSMLVIDLWWPRLLQLFNYMLGLVMVAAMGFTCSQMVRHRELVAILASGQSLMRVARPVLLGAVILSVLQAANQEFVIPRIAPLLAREHGDAGRRDLGALQVSLVADSEGNVLHAEAFDADQEILEDLYIIIREQHATVGHISAERGRWTGHAWTLEGGVDDEGDPVPEFVTDLSPTALKMSRFQSYRNSLSWSQVGQMLELTVDEDRRAELQRIRLGRFSVILANMLALLIALPFFVTREPVNMVVQSLRCAPIAITALMGGILGAYAPMPGIPATIGVFIPVMVLLPIALGMVSSIRT